VQELDPVVQSERFKAYAGRWIACIREQVIGQGGTPEQALHAAQASRFKEIPQITYIPPIPPLQINPFLERIAARFAPDFPVYLVGGAVRNALLNRPVSEMDFVLPEHAIKHARKIADHFNGAFYILDQERDYGRVLIPQPDGKRLVLDFAPLQGINLEEDLKNRDFTINALAVGIHPPYPLYDPWGGAPDLHARRLRTCSPGSFRDDPIRILRGIRFSLQFDVRPDKETKERMRAEIGLIQDASAERLRDELFHLLESRKPAAAIKILDSLDALQYCLPELCELHGLEQTAPHILDAWQHTLEVGNQLEKILDVLDPRVDVDKTSNLQMGLISLKLGRYRKHISDHLQQDLVEWRSIRALIFLAAFYHDCGKPFCQEMGQDGAIRYINHELVGADLVTRRGTQLQLSNNEIKRLQLIVRNHMRPLWLAQTGSLPSRRAKFRFFTDTGSAGVDICLLSLADTLATYGYTLPADVWQHHVEVVRSLLEAWWEHKEEEISPSLYVDGNDLIDELKIKPGPVIGELLDEIKEAQAIGEITNRRQALELAHKILNGKRSE
jgi:poly(A) polymerase